MLLHPVALHVNIAVILSDVVDSTLDAVLVGHIHNKRDDLTPRRANLVCRSVDAGTFFQDFLTSSGDVNFGSVCGQGLCVHFIKTLAGQ